MMRNTIVSSVLIHVILLAALSAARSPSTFGDEYQLRYKFNKGETLRWKVDHRASTETTIKGNKQESVSHSVSTKVWRVEDVAPNGNAKFIHQVDDVDMWQEVTGRPRIRYNSTTDAEPPLAYQAVAETVGVPMFTVTVDPIGRVLNLQANSTRAEQSQIGLEQMTVPLPLEPVKIGTSWHVPGEVSIRLQDAQVKRVKIRRLYTLAKVQTGVATIDVGTEVLTPIHDPKEKVQLMQRLNEGSVRFDIDAGRILSKEMQWNESVVNFNGPESHMQYLARFNEQYLRADESTAQKPQPATPAGPRPATTRR